jgi:hypothetical protein
VKKGKTGRKRGRQREEVEGRDKKKNTVT